MLRITHRDTDQRRPWYVTCDVCGLYTIGEPAYAEDLDGTECPVCTPDNTGEQLTWVELDDGSGDWVVAGVEGDASPS